jgi:hypothetical protein
MTHVSRKQSRNVYELMADGSPYVIQNVVLVLKYIMHVDVMYSASAPAPCTWSAARSCRWLTTLCRSDSISSQFLAPCACPPHLM